MTDTTTYLFFTGKGGVGKTSLACATAVELADSGKVVLLVSTDPASNLKDVLESSVDENINPVKGIDNLFAININPENSAEEYRNRVTQPLEGIDPAATFVYQSNSKDFKESIVKSNIKDVPHISIPDFDFMIAGFPCQPFSNAGLRKGISDERGNLFEECEKILLEKQESLNPPIGFVFENVRGIMSSKMPDGISIPEEIVKRTKKIGLSNFRFT